MPPLGTVRRLNREITTAAGRFSCVRAQRENRCDPDLGELRSAFDPLLDRVRDNVEAVKHLHLDARKPPWTATGVEVSEGQEISVFATGRP